MKAFTTPKFALHSLLAALFTLSLPLHAAPAGGNSEQRTPLAPGKSQQLTSPDQVPEGMAKSDWQSIRAAYEAGRHAFHRVEGQDGVWQARNPGQQWRTTFDQHGFTTKADDGAWTWGLELESDADIPVCTSAQKADKNVCTTLSFPRSAAITEWFVNDQRGLEQGWTLSAPAEIRLRVRGSLKASVSAQSISFGGQITYAGLKAWDATGKTVPTHFEPTTEGFAVRYDDSAALYPITIDPIAQQAYLKASNTGAADLFGYSVAVAGDTAVIGAFREDSNATTIDGDGSDNSASDSGAAYVFTRSGSTWSQQAYLKANNSEANDYFGYSVAVSGDTVVVGANGEKSNANTVNGDGSDNSAVVSGAAYVFTRSGSSWSQQAYLKANNSQGIQGNPDKGGSDGDLFGFSVAVSGDTAVIGAYQEDSTATSVNGDGSDNSASDSGAAYVFTRSGSSWSQQAYLKASNSEARDLFGSSVAVSGDTAVIGATGEDSNATTVNGDGSDNSADRSGAAYVFTRSGSTWSQQAYLKANNSGANDYFGSSVAVSGDTAVIGANGEYSNASSVNGDGSDNSAFATGAAYVFTRSGSTWSQQAYLKTSNSQMEDYFGFSVAVSGDTAVIGAYGEDSNATTVNGDGSDNSATSAGAAYVFTGLGPVVATPAPTVTSVSPTNGSTLGGTSVTITGTGFTGATAVTIGGTAATFAFVSDSSLTASTPAGSAGTASVLVTTPSGTNAANTLFTYTPPNAAPSFTLPAGVSTPAGATWTVRDSSREWRSITSSADGSKLAAVENYGQIYTSTDSGVSWTARESNRQWYSITSSADGSKLAAVVQNGQIYTSTDSGATWTARESTRTWFSITSSADGSKLAAVVHGGQIYTSTDSGATWAARESGRGWYSITSSADGSKLAAVDYNGRIYTSTDSGVTWTARESVRLWNSITSSADGSKLAAVAIGGQIYTSTDSGATWTARDSNRNWYSITSSADGSKLAAVVEFGQIYTSTDSGETWSPRESDRRWRSITSSADGSKLAAAVRYDQIYTSVGVSTPYHLSVSAGSGPQTIPNFATEISPGPVADAGQTVSFTVTNNNTSLFTTQPTLASNGTLTFTPGSSPGVATVTVTAVDDGGTANGGVDTSAPQTFTLTVTNSAPTVTSISPTSGSTAGGTNVTITGTNFTGATGVTIGGAAATPFTVVNATTITTTTPAHAAGAVSVVVTTPSGANAANTLFTYVFSEIAVTGNSVDITSGDITPTTTDHSDFGIQLASTGSKSRIFTITNSGTADLTIGTISFSGTGMADFSVVSTPDSPLAPASVTTFEVVFDPAAVGLSTATLSFATNDLDENPFTFALQGTGSDGTPAVAAAEFSQPGTGGTQISGAAAGTTLYQFGGAPALNASGAAAYSSVIRHPDGTLHHAMLAGSPATILVQDTTDMSALPTFGDTLPANTKFLNFRSPLISPSGRVAFVADLTGTGLNGSNRRGVFTNVADGTLRILMRQGGPDPATGSTFSAVGVVTLAGDGVIFTANTIDGKTGLYGYDPVEGVDLLFRTGSVIGSGGSNKTVSAFSILATSGYTPGQGQEHVADALNPGDRLTTLACTFTDGSSGVIKARFNSTSGYTGFADTYAEKGRLIDFAAGADAVLPLAKFENGFNKPGWDQTGTYYGFMGYLMRGVAGVNDYTDAALFVDLDPEQLVMQVREGSAVTGITGATYKDFYSLMVGGGDYEFAFLADMRGTGITAANDLCIFAKHTTLGIIQVAREGGAAAGVSGGLFQNLNQMALPGDGQPILNATLALGSGGVTTSNDNGLWVMNGLGELRLAVREGDVFTLGGSPRTVTTIQSLGSGSSAAVGARIFTADGTLKIQVGFTDGTQGFIEVLVP